MVVGSYGSRVVFEVTQDKVITPQSVKREFAAAYEEHKILAAKPRLEFLYPELSSFSFTVLFSASFGVNPRDQMLFLESYTRQGAAEQLILGGINYGRHVITKVSENWMKSNPSGIPISIQANLEFRQYSV